MTKVQADKYMSMLVTEGFLVEKQVQTDAILATLPDNRTDFINILIEVRAQLRKISKNNDGYTISKRDLRQKLVEEAYSIGKATELYYTMVVKDPTLSARASFSRTDMARLSTDALIVKARLICETALPVKALLLPYGVDEASVEALPGHTDAFFDAKQLPRESRTKNKNAGSDLMQLFKTADKALEELDALFEVLRYKHPALFREYQLSRKIRHSPTNHILKSGLLKPAMRKAASYARGYLHAQNSITLINESARTKGAALQFYFAAKKGDLPASTQPIIEVPAGSQKTIPIAKHGFSAATPVLMVFNPSTKKIRWKTRVVLKVKK